jgi:hypothetical protein
VLGPSSLAGREIASAMIAGRVQELATAGLLERVSRIRVLSVTASCRSTTSIAGGVVCTASVDEQSTASPGTDVRQRKHVAEAPGVSVKDSVENIASQLAKEL